MLPLPNGFGSIVEPVASKDVDVRRLDPLRMALRPLGSGPCLTACALLLHRRGTDGHRRDYSQLEQG